MTHKELTTMANKSVSYVQVPVAQKDLAQINIERLNAEGTLFNAKIVYEVFDDQGNKLATRQFEQQGPGVLAAAAISALLAAINAVEGT